MDVFLDFYVHVYLDVFLDVFVDVYLDALTFLIGGQMFELNWPFTVNTRHSVSDPDA